MKNLYKRFNYQKKIIKEEIGKAKSPKNIFKIQAPNSGQVIVNINLNYNMNVKEEAKYSSV